MNKHIYISFKWNNISQTIKDQLSIELSNLGWQVITDDSEIRTMDNIQKFMDDLSSSKKIVLIISNEYLKSEDCLYELNSIYQNLKGKFKEYVYVISTPCALLNSNSEITNYQIHWQQEKQNLEAGTKELEIKATESNIKVIKKHNIY